MLHRTLSSLVCASILAMSSLSSAQSARTSPPSCEASPPADASYVIELGAYFGPNAERAEWTHRLSLVTNAHGSLRFNGANGTLVDLSLSLRPTRDPERVIVEIDLREERSRGAERTSRHTRQSLLVRRGETSVLGGAWPDGQQRTLRVIVR